MVSSSWMIDVDEDPELEARYDELVPVLLAGMLSCVTTIWITPHLERRLASIR